MPEADLMRSYPRSFLKGEQKVSWWSNLLWSKDCIEIFQRTDKESLVYHIISGLVACSSPSHITAMSFCKTAAKILHRPVYSSEQFIHSARPILGTSICVPERRSKDETKLWASYLVLCYMLTLGEYLRCITKINSIGEQNILPWAVSDDWISLHDR